MQVHVLPAGKTIRELPQGRCVEWKVLHRLFEATGYRTCTSVRLSKSDRYNAVLLASLRL